MVVMIRSSPDTWTATPQALALDLHSFAYFFFQIKLIGMYSTSGEQLNDKTQHEIKDHVRQPGIAQPETIRFWNLKGSTYRTNLLNNTNDTVSAEAPNAVNSTKYAIILFSSATKCSTSCMLVDVICEEVKRSIYKKKSV